MSWASLPMGSGPLGVTLLKGHFTDWGPGAVFEAHLNQAAALYHEHEARSRERVRLYNKRIEIGGFERPQKYRYGSFPK